MNVPEEIQIAGKAANRAIRGRIVFVVTEDWYFCSHRLPIARAARDAGYEVWVVTRINEHEAVIRNEEFRVVPLDFKRSGLNLLSDLFTIFRLAGIYRLLRPSIVHHVALKPVMYGSIAARIVGIPSVVNALAGLGFLYSSDPKGVRRLVQPLVRGIMGLVLRNTRGRGIVQNHADYDVLRDQMGLQHHKLVLIRGSGVDTQRFAPTPESAEGPVRISLVSRLLWEKGVGDLVTAAGILRARGVQCLVSLVGEPDSENPGAVNEQQLRDWARSESVEWLGRQSDVAAVWARSQIACLPSYYREGVPKSLLEAAACGRPIITSDNPGCLELVEDGINGLVVPARDPNALANAIERLIQNPQLRQSMGQEGRRIIMESFSEEHVVARTMALYTELTETAAG